jgi:hypothetical protein
VNRRGFLSLFTSAAAVAVVDPAELLWKPGTKAFSFPKIRGYRGNRLLTPDEFCALMKQAIADAKEELARLENETFRAYGFPQYFQTSGDAIRNREIYLSSRPPSSPDLTLSSDRELRAIDPYPLR